MINKKTFELEWNDDLGEGWMNLDNLEQCLFSGTYSNRALLRVTEIPLKAVARDEQKELLKNIGTFQKSSIKMIIKEIYTTHQGWENCKHDWEEDRFGYSPSVYGCKKCGINDVTLSERNEVIKKIEKELKQLIEALKKTFIKTSDQKMSFEAEDLHSQRYDLPKRK